MHAYTPSTTFDALSVSLRRVQTPQCDIDGTTFTLSIVPQIGGLIRLTVSAYRGMVALDHYAGTVERTLPASANDAAIAIEANDMVQVLLPSTYEARKTIALLMA